MSFSHLGASTVKWITPNPCLVLSESFEFCEENHRHLTKTYWPTKPSNLWWKICFQEKSTYFRRRCKWCANRWFWTSKCLNFAKYMIELYKIDVNFYKVLWWCPQVDNEIREYKIKISKKSNFKIFKVIRFMLKTILIHLHLSTIANKKFRGSQLHILNLSIYHNNRGYHR